jgi:hypothetical protein
MEVGLALLLFGLVGTAVGLVWALACGHLPGWAECSEAQAAGRANVLLEQILGEEVYLQLVQSGYLDVPSPAIAGRIYRIPSFRGRVEVIEHGSLVAKLCVVSAWTVPDADMVLTHKLLIEGDEARYLRIANHFPAGGARRT